MEPHLGSVLIKIMSLILGFYTFVRLNREPVIIVVDDDGGSSPAPSAACTGHDSSSLCSGQCILYIFRVGPLWNMHETWIQTLIKEAKLQMLVRVGVAVRLKRASVSSSYSSLMNPSCSRQPRVGAIGRVKPKHLSQQQKLIAMITEAFQSGASQGPPPHPTHSLGAQRNILPTRNAVK